MERCPQGHLTETLTQYQSGGYFLVWSHCEECDWSSTPEREHEDA